MAPGNRLQTDLCMPYGLKGFGFASYKIIIIIIQLYDLTPGELGLHWRIFYSTAYTNTQTSAILALPELISQWHLHACIIRSSDVMGDSTRPFTLVVYYVQTVEHDAGAHASRVKVISQP